MHEREPSAPGTNDASRVRMSSQPEKVPAIEPPCPDCESVRRLSGNTQAWCAHHAEHHVHGHAYHYERELPLAQHDSAVSPTGVDGPTSR